MNEEDLEKTRALNELSDLIDENNNNSSSIYDTKDASEIIEIPDDINQNENKEELFKDLTSLKSINLSGWEFYSGNGTNSRQNDNLIGLFSGCSALEVINLSGCNMNSIGLTTNIFSGCSSLKKIMTPNSISTSISIGNSLTFYETYGGTSYTSLSRRIV